MLAEELPNCLCGARNYHGGGGSIGGEISYTNFRCSTCGRGVFVIEEKSPLFLIDTGASQPSKLMENYINNILITAIRASRAAKEERVIPPQLPDEVTACYLEHSNVLWHKVDHLASRKIPVPPDPIRISHDEFWGKLMDKMELTKSIKEIPNRYCDDDHRLEPWYEMGVDAAVIRFGPRKRVLAIQVTSETSFQCEGIAKAAKRDNVTFEADGHWQPWDQRMAKSIEVHAWGEEKFISYFGWIMWDLGRTSGGAMKEARP
jgi:hypothetical protein